MLGWLDSYSPDVLALQETKARNEDFPEKEIRERGWNVVYQGEKSYNGVAVISKNPADAADFGLGDDAGESNTRLAVCRFGDVHVINTYVPQGQSLDSDKFAFKLEWFRRLRRCLDSRFDPARDKVVWVGDLNVAPTPIDVYDSKAVWPHVCHCREVIDAFAGVCDFGFADVFRAFIPEADRFTFWDYRQKGSLDRNRGWRIDHILATPPMAGLARACAVDVEPRRRERPSDHTFVYADFSI